MKQNIIQEKSYQFALSIIGLYRELINAGVERILARQLLSCGTSIGANVEEAIGGQTKKDFISKMSIAYKEAREALYWIKLLTDSGILNTEQSEPVLIECEEILKISGSIISTAKQSLTKP